MQQDVILSYFRKYQLTFFFSFEKKFYRKYRNFLEHNSQERLPRKTFNVTTCPMILKTFCQSHSTGANMWPDLTFGFTGVRKANAPLLSFIRVHQSKLGSRYVGLRGFPAFDGRLTLMYMTRMHTVRTLSINTYRTTRQLVTCERTRVRYSSRFARRDN